MYNILQEMSNTLYKSYQQQFINQTIINLPYVTDIPYSIQIQSFSLIPKLLQVIIPLL